MGEVARILRPGARFAFTADEGDDLARPGAVPDWAPIIEAPQAAQDLIDEATHVGPTLANRTGVRYATRNP
jgi:hypothetical protein